MRARTLVPAIAGLVLLAVLALVVRGCAGSGVRNLSFPTPPSTASGSGDTTTTGIPDLTRTSLTPVPAGAPRTVPIVPGAATLAGVVTGPNGVVAGAIVHAERLIGDAIGATNIATQPDGTWRMPGILGGRYRIRAWRAPDLALTTPQILYLRGNETQNLSLSLATFNGISASASVTPGTPLLGQTVILVVQVSTQAVGTDGVVREAPLPAAMVDVTSAANVTINGDHPATADANGRATWLMTCSAPGPEVLSATVDSVSNFPLTTPDCGSTAYVPPTTSTTVPGFPTTSLTH